MTETHVDGNALGGLFIDMFGREMTDQLGCCGECGNVSAFGAVRVFRGPGLVLRCPFCGKVAMVIVGTADGLRVTLGSLQWIAIDHWA
ncbi:MAG TPA: DUF6510 family protein [Acidimicrobiia bacterium]|jgi:hypothetical protein